MAELAEGTGSLGTPHPDPNLDGWSNPNTGWPSVNTTRMAKNSLKVSTDGSVCVIAVGRRTITTANAYQKMVKPFYGGKSCWNSFARVYDDSLHVPLYSSLVVGQWDTLTQTGGDNTELFGMYKTNKGIVCVGRQKADTLGNPTGNPIPVTNVSTWAANIPQNQSAIVAYFQATNLFNDNDSIATTSVLMPVYQQTISVFPNPSTGIMHISFSDKRAMYEKWNYVIYDYTGRKTQIGKVENQTIEMRNSENGVYFLHIIGEKGATYVQKVVINH